MALTDLTRISTSGIATGSTIDAAILRKDVSFRGNQVGVTSALFDSSDNALEFNDNVKLKIGTHGDIQIYNDGTKSVIENGGNSLGGNNNSLHIYSQNDILHNTTYSQYFHCGAVNKNSTSPRQLALIRNEGVKAYYNNNLKFETTNHGATVTGILTATGFSGPLSNASGISTFYDLRVTNNLTVEGTTTTLDTNLIGVDRIEVGANSNTVTGIAVTQSGTADLVRLYDGASQVVTVDDVGNVGINSTVPTQKLDIIGNIKAGGDINFPTSMDSTESGGVAIQRFWSTGTITAGSAYKCGKWEEGEGSVQLSINVRSETASHSGTATYLWQGGYLPIGGTGYSRLFPLSSGNGHGDGADNGLNTGGWGVIVRQSGSYGFEIWVYVPSGKANKALKVTVTELNRGNTFTDLSASASMPSLNASYQNSIKNTSIEQLYFKDNKYAYFGDSQDLQLYHAGNHSYIKDAGTGSLLLQGNQIALQDTGGNNHIITNAGTDVQLYYDFANSSTPKLKTTSTGARIDTVLLLHGDAGNPGRLRLQEGAALSEIIGTRNSDANSDLQFKTEMGDGTQVRAKINYSGDFVVPNNKIGIGTDIGQRALTIRNAEPRIRLIDDDTGSFSEVYTDNTGHLYLNADSGQNNGGSRIVFRTDAGERARIDNNGNFIFYNSAAAYNTLQRANAAHYIGLRIQETNGTQRMQFGVAGTINDIVSGSAQHDVVLKAYDANLILATNATEKLRITSAGSVGIGITNPSFSTINSVSGSNVLGIEIFQDVNDTATALKLAADNGSGNKAYSQLGYSGANATAHWANYNTSGTLQGQIIIGSTGNIGIGTVNPLTRLHVADTNTTVWPFTSAVSTNYSYNPYPHELVIDNDVKGTEGSFAGIFFNAGSDTDGSKVSTARIAAVDTGSYKADLVFSNRGFGGSSHKENLRITSDGNVNIGSGTHPSSGYGRLNVKPSTPDSYFKIRNAADFDGTLIGNVIDNRTSDNSTSRDLIVRSMNLVLWQEATEKVRITSTGLVRIGGATANSADIDSTNTKLTIKQTANNREDGIYIERSGERRGHYIYVGGALGQSDALCFATNQLGTDTDLLAIDRGGDVVVGAGNFGVGDFSTAGPRADVHIVSSQPEIRLTNTTQPNNADCGKIRITEYESSYMGGYMHFDGSANVLHFGVHENNDSNTANDVNSISIDRDTGQVHLRYGGNTKLKTTNSGVDFDSGTSTLVKIIGDSAGSAGLSCGGDGGQGQCTGYVEVHQDQNHGGGIFYNGDASPSFATHEGADYFSLFRLSSGSRYSVMRWYHDSQDCEVQGNMIIDNGYTSSSTLLRVRADSSGTAGIRAGGDSNQNQCTGYVEVHQDESHGGGMMYNGDGSPAFVSGETADNITFYRLSSGSRTEVFRYPHNSNNCEFNGSITQNASDIRLKTNIKIIDNPIEKIKKIRGTTFDWVDDITSEYGFTPAAKHETGVIAQEIQEVVPDAVVTAPFNGGYTQKSGKDHNFLTVKPEKIIPLCIEAIKELSTEIENLKAEIAALKSS